MLARRYDLPPFPTRRSSDLIFLAKTNPYPARLVTLVKTSQTPVKRTKVEYMAITPHLSPKPRVLVIGGGYAGYNVAKRLQKKRSEEHTSELQSRGHLVCRLP